MCPRVSGSSHPMHTESRENGPPGSRLNVGNASFYCMITERRGSSKLRRAGPNRNWTCRMPGTCVEHLIVVKSPAWRAVVLSAALCAGSLIGLPHRSVAQGVSTGAIRGAVRTTNGASADGARIRVTNTATGFTATTQVSRGRFLVHGLDVGGQYVVEVRHIGFMPQRSQQLSLTLGEPLDLQFVLQQAAVQLDQVTIAVLDRAPGRGGAATIIRDSLVSRLPTLNRNFLDFVALTPQVSTKIGFQRSGMSAAGANLRFNNYLINGVDERFVNSNVSPANAGRSIPIDAVKEYQVLVSPYDVRYGDFAGALVNTVTKSGTNELRGTTFAYWRTNRLARGGSGIADTLHYERLQYGFSLGGPLVRDKVHFFIAPELQRLTSPGAGPYVGQPSDLTPPLLVSEADVDRFASILRAHGLVPGSGGATRVENPLRNLFARLDVALPRWNSRVVGLTSYSGVGQTSLSRSERDFSLSSGTVTTTTRLQLTSLQMHTDFPRSGGHNELLVSLSSDWAGSRSDVRQPLVSVPVRGTTGETVTLHAGPVEFAQAGARRGRAVKVKNELTLPWGANHIIALGGQAEWFQIRPGGVSGSYGVWTFSSLDAFAQGVADRFELRKDLGGALTPLRGGQYAGYVGDDWRAADRLSVTFGARADLLDPKGYAPYNPDVDSVFGRRTDEKPLWRIVISPRIGFTWDVDRASHQRLRGGVGIFAGRPPLAWLHPAWVKYGVGIGTLSCGASPTDAGAPPAFEPDYRQQPTACATGPGLTTAATGDVDLLDRNVGLAQALRGSVAYDRRLPWGVTATTELVATRYLSDFMFVNLNLAAPKGVDRFGRVMYAAIGSNGIPQPATRSAFSEVIDLRRTSKNYSYHASGRVEKTFSQGIAATASYTFSRTRDVESPSRVNSPGLNLWADARAVSGRHDDVPLGISLNDIPHRVVGAIAYTAPWPRWSTALSLYYVGESGSPFTYRAGGAGRRGDLNADGSNINDPIYVPRDATDPAEILFDGASAEQQDAFEDFVRRTPCLRRQRGRILERNSCREPFSHTTIASLRQTVSFGPRALEAELDVFNVLNLINSGWGHYRVASPRVLEHVGQSAGSVEASQPIFRFSQRPDWMTLPTESAFQLQLALRYRF